LAPGLIQLLGAAKNAKKNVKFVQPTINAQYAIQDTAHTKTLVLNLASNVHLVNINLKKVVVSNVLIARVAQLTHIVKKLQENALLIVSSQILFSINNALKCVQLAYLNLCRKLNTLVLIAQDVLPILIATN